MSKYINESWSACVFKFDTGELAPFVPELSSIQPGGHIGAIPFFLLRLCGTITITCIFCFSSGSLHLAELPSRSVVELGFLHEEMVLSHAEGVRPWN